MSAPGENDPDVIKEHGIEKASSPVTQVGGWWNVRRFFDDDISETPVWARNGALPASSFHVATGAC